MAHTEHPLYVENEGCFKLQAVLPLPPAEGFPHPVCLLEPTEPRFDPSLHLNLSMPDYVVTFPHMKKVKHAPPVTSNKGSSFAFSGPFQLLSEEGLRVVRSIVQREEHRYGDLSSIVVPHNDYRYTFRAVASARGSKRALRGLYYSSPFIRDLQNCPQLLEMFQVCVGEKLLPHFCFSNSPQVLLNSCYPQSSSLLAR